MHVISLLHDWPLRMWALLTCIFGSAWDHDRRLLVVLRSVVPAAASLEQATISVQPWQQFHVIHLIGAFSHLMGKLISEIPNTDAMICERGIIINIPAPGGSNLGIYILGPYHLLNEHKPFMFIESVLRLYMACLLGVLPDLVVLLSGFTRPSLVNAVDSPLNLFVRPGLLLPDLAAPTTNQMQYLALTVDKANGANKANKLRKVNVHRRDSIYAARAFCAAYMFSTHCHT